MGSNRGRDRLLGRTNNLKEWSIAMGIDWMTRNEITQAIPPAYTEWLGHYLRATLLVERQKYV